MLRPGSLLWYAALFSEQAHRPAIEAVCGVWFELRGIAENAREPQATRLRLAWWQEEFGRLPAGTPRHPLCRTLLPLVPDPEWAAALLNELVTGSVEELDRLVPQNADELRLAAFRAAGAPLALLGESLGAPRAVALETGKHVGHVVQCSRWLAGMGPDLRRGRLRLPTEGADEVDEAQIADAAAALVDSAESAQQAAYTALADPRAATLRFHRVLLALHAALLARARRRPEAPHARPAIALPPWRRLWTAWRAARASIGET